MTSKKQSDAAPAPQLSRQEEEKLLALWRQLKELAKSDYPAVRAGCEKASNEVWQVIFELGLVVDDGE